MQGFQNFIARTWGSGKRGKIGIGCAALVFFCVLCVVGAQLYSATPQGQAGARAWVEKTLPTLKGEGDVRIETFGGVEYQLFGIPTARFLKMGDLR